MSYARASCLSTLYGISSIKYQASTELKRIFTRYTSINYIIYRYQIQQFQVMFIRGGGNMLKLKELREQRRLNQEGLALKLNVSQSTISAYEVGERAPDFDTLIAIAKFFDVSLDYLAGLTNLKQPIRQSDLSSNELEHLHTYRQLSDIEKGKVAAYIDGLLSKT